MTDNYKNSKLQVDLINLDQITESTLSFFFNSNLCLNAELNKSNNIVDLLILDYERGIDENLINSLAKNNQCAIILHMDAKIPKKVKRVLWLVKPIKANQLKKTIDAIYTALKKEEIVDEKSIPVTKPTVPFLQKKEIKKETSSKNSHLFLAVNEESESEMHYRYKSQKYVGSNKDINPENTLDNNHIYLTPDKYLYFYLSKSVKMAYENKSSVLIKTILGNIEFNHKTHYFHHNIDEKRIRYMQTSPLFQDATLSLIDTNIKSKTSKKIRFNSMIWESAIIASKGRLPIGTNLENNVLMKAWPNFSKLIIFRYSIQVSAAWSRHKLSLINTAKQINIPQRYVFTLYCAMHAIECATTGSTISNSEIDITKNKSVFSKILSHIFKKNKITE